MYQNPENDHSADEDAGFAAMKKLATEMNTGLKQQNSKLKHINDKQVRNKNKMDQVQSKLNKNLDGYCAFYFVSDEAFHSNVAKPWTKHFSPMSNLLYYRAYSL